MASQTPRNVFGLSQRTGLDGLHRPSPIAHMSAQYRRAVIVPFDVKSHGFNDSSIHAIGMNSTDPSQARDPLDRLMEEDENSRAEEEKKYWARWTERHLQRPREMVTKRLEDEKRSIALAQELERKEIEEFYSDDAKTARNSWLVWHRRQISPAVPHAFIPSPVSMSALASSSSSSSSSESQSIIGCVRDQQAVMNHWAEQKRRKDDDARRRQIESDTEYSRKCEIHERERVKQIENDHALAEKYSEILNHH